MIGHLYPRRAAARALLVLPLTFSAAGSQEAEPPSPPTESVPLFRSRDLAYAGIVALGTVAVAPLDKRFADFLQGNWQTRRTLRRLSYVVETITQPGAWFIGGGLFVAGKVFDSRAMTDLGLHGSEAIAIGLAFTTVVKMTAGRARPYVDRDRPHDFKLMRGLNEERYRSFPSGHSLIAFAAATVAARETHRWWPEAQWIVEPTMYGGATLVALSRMYDNKHWASDVIMGSALGVLSGSKVYRFHHLRPPSKLDRWLIGASLVPADAGGWALRWLAMPDLRPAPD